MSTFKVQVSKDYTSFAAAHFVSYDGDKVEPLHGHNYGVTAGAEGGLDEDGYVVNFTPLKKALRRVCDGLDHRLLLPTGNPLIDIQNEAGGYVVRSAAKTYRFPDEDVVQLPIRNTTAELLAQWIEAEVEAQLRAAGVLRPGLLALTIEVAESLGQSATCRRELE